MKCIAVIPARMGSTRFPGKPLAPLLGKPMIQWVYEGCKKSKQLDDIIIATCDEEIKKVAEAFGAKVVMTSSSHERCTDRVAEAIKNIDANIIVIVQGDEPMVSGTMIDTAIQGLIDSPNVFCVNLTKSISESEAADVNEIKVVFNHDKNALFFSRNPIPSHAKYSKPILYYKQICIMPFYREKLSLFNTLAPTSLEIIESIDMLRILEHGFNVKCIEIQEDTCSVDTLEDLRKVETLLKCKR